MSLYNRVSLVSSASRRQRVVFDVSPKLSESRSVEYTPVAPLHMPGSIQVYKTTNSRTFGLTASFISRTVGEATANSLKLQWLRGWTMPYFGTGSSYAANNTYENQTSATTEATATSSERVVRTTTEGDYDGFGINSDVRSSFDEMSIPSQQALDNTITQMQRAAYDLLGAPPDVLLLSAYTTSQVNQVADQSTFNLRKIPVVVTSLDFSYPDDVDYIPTQTGEPFPIKMDVSISLIETHAPVEFESFSLQQYRAGRLSNF